MDNGVIWTFPGSCALLFKTSSGFLWADKYQTEEILQIKECFTQFIFKQYSGSDFKNPV